MEQARIDAGDVFVLYRGRTGGGWFCEIKRGGETVRDFLCETTTRTMGIGHGHTPTQLDVAVFCLLDELKGTGLAMRATRMTSHPRTPKEARVNKERANMQVHILEAINDMATISVGGLAPEPLAVAITRREDLVKDIYNGFGSVRGIIVRTADFKDI